jgi:hypothetical protein
MSKSMLATRVIKRSRRDNALLVEAVAALLAAWAAVRFLPFRRAIVFGSRALGSLAPAVDANAIGRSIVVAGKWVPWRAVCFQQGLALQWMLRRRGFDARLHYGVGYAGSAELQAHVWVTVGDEIVIGAQQVPLVRCVASYPQAPNG